MRTIYEKKKKMLTFNMNLLFNLKISELNLKVDESRITYR